jgi:hypothetical protein
MSVWMDGGTCGCAVKCVVDYAYIRDGIIDKKNGSTWLVCVCHHGRQTQRRQTSTARTYASRRAPEAVYRRQQVERGEGMITHLIWSWLVTVCVPRASKLSISPTDSSSAMALRVGQCNGAVGPHSSHSSSITVGANGRRMRVVHVRARHVKLRPHRSWDCVQQRLRDTRT